MYLTCPWKNVFWVYRIVFKSMKLNFIYSLLYSCVVGHWRSRCVGVGGEDFTWILAIVSFLLFILFSSVEWLIIDESDKLFEEGKTGFRDQLGIIYQACDSSQVRRAMFSATFAFDVEQWCRLNLDNVVTVGIGARSVLTSLKEKFTLIFKRKKQVSESFSIIRLKLGNIGKLATLWHILQGPLQSALYRKLSNDM